MSRLRESDRAYVTLKYLNTAPRVSYLARIKNPNLKMPGADRVGTANGQPHGHGSTSREESPEHDSRDHQEKPEESHH